MLNASKFGEGKYQPHQVLGEYLIEASPLRCVRTYVAGAEFRSTGLAVSPN